MRCIIDRFVDRRATCPLDDQSDATQNEEVERHNPNVLKTDKTLYEAELKQRYVTNWYRNPILSQSHIIAIPYYRNPILSQSHIIAIPYYRNPILSQSHIIAIPCYRNPMLSQSHVIAIQCFYFQKLKAPSIFRSYVDRLGIKITTKTWRIK